MDVRRGAATGFAERKRPFAPAGSALKTLGRITRRIAWAAFVVVVVTTLSFFVIEVLPGDPARLLLGPQASAQDVASARAAYGLDEPVYTRYARFWKRLVHLGPRDVAPKDKAHRSCGAVGLGVHIDLGFSFHYRKPVVDLLAAKIPRSIMLGFAAFLVQLTIGVSMGVFAASRRNTRWDDLTLGGTALGLSAPVFLVGLLMQYVLAYRLQLLPYDGYGKTTGEQVRSVILPALSLGVLGVALYARLTRDEVSSALAQDFARTARAKGASRARVLFVHALRTAAVPIVTVAALDLGTLVGGAIVTEKLFRWPGVGQMAVDAVLNRDGSVILGVVIFTSATVALSTALLDVVVPWIDPRIGRKEKV
ncbi:MAG: ABC transporter permease [Polyangiaceae bacterium]|nr:ABC transporter permease [Polyangiaceae bacterium]